jgi:hypothetical protein
MNIMQRFKSFDIRLPAAIRGQENGIYTNRAGESVPALVPDAPHGSLTYVEIAGSKTAVEVNAILADAAKTVTAKIGELVTAVRNGLTAAGKDASLLDAVPCLDLVAKHLVDELKIEDALKAAFRSAALEQYLEANPEVAKAIASLQKAPTGTRGLKVDVEF